MAEPELSIHVEATGVEEKEEFSAAAVGGQNGSPVSKKQSFLSCGLPVTFKGLTYTVVSNKDRKAMVMLLKDVSAFLRPGEMTALMGPSGSGKTSLLDLLTHRKTVGTISGEIKFGGAHPTPTFLKRFTGYVEQFDTLIDTLTVFEMLGYTAALKRPLEESRAEKRAAVEQLIERLALTSCRDVRIGSPLARGISGGQAKRVNIAIALVANPLVLLLDEPTSGLDSFTASEVMSVVQGLAQAGMTVAATIHSPTSFCFGLFDRLLMLLRGEIIFFGPRAAALDFFFSRDPTFKGLGHMSSAEWIVDLTTKVDRQDAVEELQGAYASSELKRIADAEILQLHYAAEQEGLDASIRKELAVRQETATPFWWALFVLLKMRALRSYASPEFLGPRIGDKMVFSLIICSMYWKVGNDLSPANIPNIVSTLFLWTVLAAFGAMAYLPGILMERPIFVRERFDGLYSVSAYLCAKMMKELGMAVITSLVFSNVVFWMLALQGEWVLFFLVYLCSLAFGIVLAYFVAASAPNMDVANVVMPTYTVSLLFFTGLLMRFDDIPVYWRWYCYIDALRYSTGALMINQFEGNRDVQFIQGYTVLQYYALDGVSKWVWLGFQSCFVLFFLLAAFLALKYISYVKR